MRTGLLTGPALPPESRTAAANRARFREGIHLSGCITRAIITSHHITSRNDARRGQPGQEPTVRKSSWGAFSEPPRPPPPPAGIVTSSVTPRHPPCGCTGAAADDVNRRRFVAVEWGRRDGSHETGASELAPPSSDAHTPGRTGVSQRQSTSVNVSQRQSSSADIGRHHRPRIHEQKNSKVSNG